METNEAVGTTAEAAFATDMRGRILAWNRGAEELLGVSERQAVGKDCFRLLRGQDVYGNRFCDERCPIRNMIRRREPIRRFEITYSPAATAPVHATLSVLVLPSDAENDFVVVHLLAPRDPNAFCATSPDRDSAPVPCLLTPREVEVLQLLADGNDTPSIADHLCISTATVRNHVHNILEKLEVHTRLQAVSKALKNHLI